METAALATPGSPAPPPAPRRGLLRALVWLLVLAALAAGAWFGWQRLGQQMQERAARAAFDQRIGAELGQLHARMDQLAREQSDAAAVAGRTSADVAALGQRVDETGAAVSRLTETVQGGRARLQLAAVEQILLMANDRALLAHDADGAAAALAQADARLGALNEPRLFKLREAIAQERAALAQVPRVDLTAAALSLSGLIAQLPQLPLQGRLPGRLTQATELGAPPEGVAWPLRLWLALKQALRATFIVRRDEGAAARLLPVEEETLVIHIGLLKLEGARLALLRGNTAAFRELCDAAGAWLHDYFETGDPAVRAAQAELQRLRTLELSPALPDISRSLELLRTYSAAPAP